MPKKAQIDKFREKARELRADEDEGHFDETLQRIAKRKPTEAPVFGVCDAAGDVPAPLKETMAANSRALGKLTS